MKSGRETGLRVPWERWSRVIYLRVQVYPKGIKAYYHNHLLYQRVPEYQVQFHKENFIHHRYPIKVFYIKVMAYLEGVKILYIKVMVYLEGVKILYIKVMVYLEGVKILYIKVMAYSEGVKLLYIKVTAYLEGVRVYYLRVQVYPEGIKYHNHLVRKIMLKQVVFLAYSLQLSSG